jgi:hypothetical protein
MNKPICLCIIWVHLQNSATADEAFMEKVLVIFSALAGIPECLESKV